MLGVLQQLVLLLLPARPAFLPLFGVAAAAKEVIGRAAADGVQGAVGATPAQDAERVGDGQVAAAASQALFLLLGARVGDQPAHLFLLHQHQSVARPQLLAVAGAGQHLVVFAVGFLLAPVAVQGHGVVIVIDGRQ